MPFRPRVLLVAEAANPEWASVPLVGWSMSQALRTVADVHLVTQVRNRGAIERKGLVEGREFTAIDSEAVAAPLYRIGAALRKIGLGWTVTTAFESISYYAFEQRVWRRFGERIRAREFDVVHRITPVSPAAASRLARWCAEAQVPFIVGPLNGGVPWPREFRRLQWKEGEVLAFLRRLHLLLPGAMEMRRSASAMIAASQTMWTELGRWQDKLAYVSENGVDPERFPLEPRPPLTPGEPLRVAFVGRLVPCKAVDMLIDAAAPLVRSGAVRVEIYGDGPELPALRRQAARLGLGQGIAFEGWVPHPELGRRLARASVFAFTSVHDFGGAVVLEAMALGLAPVIVDYGGPADYLTASTGFKVPMGPRPDIVAGFRGVLERLAADPALAIETGRRARDRILAWYTWDAKARQLLDVYRWVLGQGDRPSLRPPLPDEAPVVSPRAAG